jgi:Cys-rich repeat protein
VKDIATVTLDPTRTLASFKVSGFSTFQVRRRHHACTSNSQCPSAQTCVAGTCRTTQTDGGASGACVTNADCGSTEQCTNGTCVLRCALSTEVCGDGVDNNCNGVVDEGCPVDGGMMTCASDANCASGQTCVNGACELLDGGLDGGPLLCRVDTDCASGQACVNGVCELGDGGLDGGPMACFVDTDCASGQSCVNGVCELSDGGIDAGPGDGGFKDGGVDGGLDAGVDGGLTDGGIDAGPAPCRINADCPSNQVCIANVCG